MGIAKPTLPAPTYIIPELQSTTIAAYRTLMIESMKYVRKTVWSDQIDEDVLAADADDILKFETMFANVCIYQ
jgi:hypothetical protein